MRTRVGVFLIKEKSLLLIHRWNSGKEYFVVPGGGVDEGESPQETAIREIKEEANLDVTLGSLVMDYTLEDDGYGHPQQNIFFVSREFRGVEEFGTGGPEKELETSENRYRLEWTLFDDIPTINLVPEVLKQRIVPMLSKL